MKKIVSVLGFGVMLNSFFIPPAYAGVQCGDILVGKFASESHPTTYHLEEDLVCPGGDGAAITFESNNVVLYGHGHSIICSDGANKRGIGVQMGGIERNGMMFVKHHQALVDVEPWNCEIGILNQYSEDTLIQRTGNSDISHNGIGVKIHDTKRATMLGLHVWGNTTGIEVTNSSIPGMVNSFSMYNDGPGLVMTSTEGAIMRNNQIRLNNGLTDLSLFDSLYVFFVGGWYGYTDFSGNSFFNTSCATGFDLLIGGETTGPVCP